MKGKVGRSGLTLIELMIVIAIIAILFAIAMVGFVSIRRSSNEKATGASVKTLASAQEFFKGNDLDQNGVRDYWTGDVAGLNALEPNAGGSRVNALSDIALAAADTSPLNPGDYDNGTYRHPGVPLTRSPKSGYWYQAMLRRDNGDPLQVDTDGQGAVHNNGAFGICAIPASYGATGMYCFILNEGNSVFKRDFGNATPVVTGSRVTFADLDQWPAGPTLASDWTKSE